ncbi:hypothetical protein CERSUDRAFT_152346 [Gelatoporia subvermispora B]|uniref:Uncharacterized protein n=1 Tax=Ceriporiopsis subvermispora (strain B) TaxID=914234 RepID=M2R3Z3_CERS8|nr:hypothetical protein CERSUDRAFT_152346 [Gelatoporia subvermispora B]
MNTPDPEPARIKLTSGTFAQGSSESKLRDLWNSYPYTQQIDVVFPSSEHSEDALQRLETRYWSCKCNLNDFVEYARPDATHDYLERGILALGTSGPQGTDVWTLDTRGVLTLAVERITYTRLGLVGQPLPWKACDDIFIITISLSQQNEAPSKVSGSKWHRYGEKVKTALQAWDAWRGPWSILYTFREPNLPLTTVTDSLVHIVQPTMHKYQNVHVPVPSFQPHPGSSNPEELQDWQDVMQGLLEWVGLACLGSQRLQVNDSPDPYLAVYAAPPPSHAGETAHLRWRGLLHPLFVQDIIRAFTMPTNVPTPGFVAIAAHGIPTSPVGYLSTSGTAPLRALKPDMEDTRSLMVFGDGTRPQGYVFAESIGRWDTRWG